MLVERCFTFIIKSNTFIMSKFGAPVSESILYLQQFMERATCGCMKKVLKASLMTIVTTTKCQRCIKSIARETSKLMIYFLLTVEIDAVIARLYNFLSNIIQAKTRQLDLILKHAHKIS